MLFSNFRILSRFRKKNVVNLFRHFNKVDQKSRTLKYFFKPRFGSDFFRWVLNGRLKPFAF